MPAANREYWEAKLTRNVKRFRQQRRKLAAAGWRVVVVWECQTGSNLVDLLSALGFAAMDQTRRPR